MVQKLNADKKEGEAPLEKRYGSFVFLLLIGIGMLALSWGKWADALVDFGRELYIPWQLGEGKILYRDIAYFFGPLSPYWNAALFKVFGVHLMTLAAFNLGLVAVYAVLIYRFFVRTADSFTAFFAAAVFLFLFAFAQNTGVGNYNFICPYSHNATHASFLCFLAIYLFFLYCFPPHRSLWLAATGLILGLVFLTKAEFFMAVSFALLLGFYLVIRRYGFSFKESLFALGIFCLSFSAPLVLFLVFFSAQTSFSEALSSLLFNYMIFGSKGLASNPFYQTLAGTDQLRTNILKMLAASGGWILSVVSIALWGYGRSQSKAQGSAQRKAVILGMLGKALFFLTCFLAAWRGFEFARALPLFLPGFAIFLSFSLRDQENLKSEKTNAAIGLLVMCVYSFILLLKIFFNVHVGHYGFVLALPAVLLSVAGWFHQVPRWLERFKVDGAVSRRGGVVLLVTLIAVHAGFSAYLYSQKNIALGSGADKVIDYREKFSSRGKDLQAAIQAINKMMTQDQTFIVFPEGVMLNYQTRHANPTPYINFMPPEIQVFGERVILESLKKRPPDYFVLADKDMSEYGFRIFPPGYGNEIYDWIQENYTPVWSAGKKPFAGEGFGIVIRKRI